MLTSQRTGRALMIVRLPQLGLHALNARTKCKGLMMLFETNICKTRFAEKEILLFNGS